MLDRWQHLLRDRIAVILTVYFHSRVDIDQLSHTVPIFDTTMETIMDLVKVDRVRSRRLGATSLFFILTGAYSLSFCKLVVQ